MLFSLGLAAASIGVLLGLGDLWFQDVEQFSTPAEAARVALDNSGDEDLLLWRYLSTISNISQLVDAVRRRKMETHPAASEHYRDLIGTRDRYGSGGSALIVTCWFAHVEGCAHPTRGVPDHRL